MRPNVMTHKLAALMLGLSLVGGCTESAGGGQSATAPEFPRADRTVSAIGDTEFSTEAARDEAGEASKPVPNIRIGTTKVRIRRLVYFRKTKSICLVSNLSWP